MLIDRHITSIPVGSNINSHACNLFTRLMHVTTDGGRGDDWRCMGILNAYGILRSDGVIVTI